MKFDEYGYLMPYDIIPADLVVFKQVFVNGFPNSITRTVIFYEYEQYLLRIQQIINGPFYQWVDGSFTSQKLNSHDIDIVTFVDAPIFDANENLLKNCRLNQYVDAYFVRTFPKEPPKRFFTNQIIYGGIIYSSVVVTKNQKELFNFNFKKHEFDRKL
ncbi:DUF6932 family protein [Runella sp.]|uniref:DUF6932 family protein n=1 Tax=Runella sp. TaxID=1960881 RepID=UPI003D0A3F7B